MENVYTNEQLQRGLDDYYARKLGPSDNKFTDVIIDVIGRKNLLTDSISHYKKLLTTNIKDHFNVDREEYLHYFEFINGFKRESEYRSWHSEELVKKFEDLKLQWQKNIELLNAEIPKLAEVAHMSCIEYKNYLRDLINNQ